MPRRRSTGATRRWRTAAWRRRRARWPTSPSISAPGRCCAPRCIARRRTRAASCWPSRCITSSRTAGRCRCCWRNWSRSTARACSAKRRRWPSCRFNTPITRLGSATGSRPASASASSATGRPRSARRIRCWRCRWTVRAMPMANTRRHVIGWPCRPRWRRRSGPARSAARPRRSWCCSRRSRRCCIAIRGRTTSASACRWRTAIAWRPSG